ncbi:MAG: sn-glycerol-3-phosphate ABC transporter ATP-binding protein UgpC [Rhodobacterales bacterium]|nr:sn-glycerol-3-phosphate ABC transporter ATP-binding protein UgpC [Rhodobacterales bacterium]
MAFRGLCKKYDETTVLRGVDLEVNDGEYLVLVGPSGCGKSTLLRCLAGLESISSGDLYIGERRVNDLAPRDRDVAMVFQSYALYPHMTVRENIGFPLRIQKRSKADIAAAVEDAATMLSLHDLLDRMPAQLSGGQRQRVAMGRAIVRRPSVFLFDEPLSNLDAQLRTQLRVELKRLHRALKTTIVHVTHDQTEALTLADRILVLNGGVVQQAGSPRQLFDHPANAFVAAFIGSPAMNLLPAVGDGDVSRITGVEGTLPIPAQGPYTLGLRPTDLVLTAPSDGPVAEVDVLESTGSEAIVHLKLGPHVLVVVVPEPTSLKVGQQVGLELGTYHRFDAQTSERL